MAVDRERAADAEVVVRLHDRDREAERIKPGDDVAPAHSGADAIDPVLKEAAEQGRCVAIGGARHSMGGQSLPREGVAASLRRSSALRTTAWRAIGTALRR